MRQIVLDTETTGLEPQAGHRIIEIGCVELRNRRITGNDLHLYLNPERAIEAGAQAVHGITDADLADKPRFADIADELLNYLGDAELIIHNAPFDLGFLDHELTRVTPDAPALATRCPVTDTLLEARRVHPGQRNSLDALCKRYGIDNTQRELHGALLDAQLLAEVYLAMTGGQTDMQLGIDSGQGDADASAAAVAEQLQAAGRRPRVIRVDADEAAAHAAWLERLAAASAQGCLWRDLEADAPAAQPK